VYYDMLQAEIEQMQAAFMQELHQVSEKLTMSEKAVAELRQMRCNLISFNVSLLSRPTQMSVSKYISH